MAESIVRQEFGAKTKMNRVRKFVRRKGRQLRSQAKKTAKKGINFVYNVGTGIRNTGRRVQNFARRAEQRVNTPNALAARGSLWNKKAQRNRQRKITRLRAKTIQFKKDGRLERAKAALRKGRMTTRKVRAKSSTLKQARKTAVKVRMMRRPQARTANTGQRAKIKAVQTQLRVMEPRVQLGVRGIKSRRKQKQAA